VLTNTDLQEDSKPKTTRQKKKPQKKTHRRTYLGPEDPERHDSHAAENRFRHDHKKLPNRATFCPAKQHNGTVGSLPARTKQHKPKNQNPTGTTSPPGTRKLEERRIKKGAN